MKVLSSLGSNLQGFGVARLPFHLEAVVWPSPQHISAFSSSLYSRAVGLLLASPAPSGGCVGASRRMRLSCTRGHAHAPAHARAPSPGVTSALGKGFPPTCGAFEPLPAAMPQAAPVLLGVLPPCHPLRGSAAHRAASPSLDSPPRAGWPLSTQGCDREKQQVPALFLPWPVTSLQAWTGTLPPPSRLGSSLPQQPAHPRGIHVPHLGVINRHVATPHCCTPQLLLPLMPRGLFMCCGSHRTCSGCSAAQEPSGCEVGLM